MLIKLKNGTWQDMSNVVGLRVALCKGMSRCYYTILVSMKNGEEFGYKECCKYLYGNSCYYGYYWNPGYNLERYFRRFLR